MKFEEIVYSVAGSSSKRVYDLFKSISQDLISLQEHVLLKVMIESYEDTGKFPSYDFLSNKFEKIERGCRTATDVHVALKELLKERESIRLKKGIQKGILSNDPEQIRSLVGDVLRTKKISSSNIKTLKEISDGNKADFDGIGKFNLGVKQVDEVTGGFIHGLTATLAGWTSHGKSTVWNNAVYVNAMSGRKIAIFSLEIPQIMVYMIILSRHSYEYGKRIINYEQVFKNKLSEADKDFFYGELKDDFHKKLEACGGDIRIMTTEDIPQFSKENIWMLYKEMENSMGGLDYVIWDHVNLFMYLDPNSKITGDYCIKVLADICKNYRTDQDTLIGTGLAAQVNREGWKKATKSDGRYNMLALSEFHELERSSTYVVMIYSDQYMMKVNEMKIQLIKHRIGALMMDPAVTYIKPECSVVGDSYNATIKSSDGFSEMVDDFLSTEMDGFSL